MNGRAVICRGKRARWSRAQQRPRRQPQAGLGAEVTVPAAASAPPVSASCTEPPEPGLPAAAGQPRPRNGDTPEAGPGAAQPACSQRPGRARGGGEGQSRRPPAPQVAVGEVRLGDELLHPLQGRAPVLRGGHAAAPLRAAHARPPCPPLCAAHARGGGSVPGRSAALPERGDRPGAWGDLWGCPGVSPGARPSPCL